ncbi:hypothetical protein LUZ60_000658 [Juncus effusus]|nr:hypothetical protein LUZ60_000658 [Juncus effusus]
MVLPTALFKRTAHWFFTCYIAARKIKTFSFHHINPNARALYNLSSIPDISKCSLQFRETQTVVCDLQNTLLRNGSTFPFFMLVAFEGGGILRALLLLLFSPFIFALGSSGEVAQRLLVFLTFFGLRAKDVELVSRSVLPKFFLENLNSQAYEILSSCGEKVVVTTMPRVMIENFLKEYIGVNRVYGVELEMGKGGKFFNGFVSCSGFQAKQGCLKDLFGEVKSDLGLLSASNAHDQLLIPYCKETYLVSKYDGPISSTKNGNSNSSILPRDKRYPKPLIFHDGRLAFLPTPLACLSLFLFLPMGIFLALIRIIFGIIFPYKVSVIIIAMSGIHFRVKASPKTNSQNPKNSVLYVCTHRTLVDPIVLSMGLQRSVSAVTYSLSRVIELISPIKTVRLTRDRQKDANTMQKMLKEGDLAVCPEGTTCREPYLLRFSPLFAEMTDEIQPAAIDCKTSMFYGTTASGLKFLDPVMLMMNPALYYRIHILDRVEKGLTCAGGWSATDVANRVQRQLADTLGFQCTNLTRKDKYMMLAGNDGVVSANHGKLEGKIGGK